jgi:hypothetical protein
MRSLAIFFVCLVLLGVSGVVAGEQPSPVVTVVWEKPDSYIDVRATIEPQGKFEKRLFAALGDFIEAEAAKILLPGQQLKVTIHNLDMAGYIEMNLLRMGEWIRVVRDPDHVMIEIEHQLVDKSGEIISELRKSYTSLTRSQWTPGAQSRTFQYEKQIIREWLRSLTSG